MGLCAEYYRESQVDRFEGLADLGLGFGVEGLWLRPFQAPHDGRYSPISMTCAG